MLDKGVFVHYDADNITVVNQVAFCSNDVFNFELNVISAENLGWEDLDPKKDKHITKLKIALKNGATFRIEEGMDPNSLRELGEMFLRAAYRLEEKGY